MIIRRQFLSFNFVVHHVYFLSLGINMPNLRVTSHIGDASRGGIMCPIVDHVASHRRCTDLHQNSWLEQGTEFENLIYSSFSDSQLQFRRTSFLRMAT